MNLACCAASDDLITFTGMIQKRWQLEQRGKRTDVFFFHIFIFSSFIFYRLFEFLQICTTKRPTRIDTEVKHL